MLNTPLVSVIIPVYNGEQFLAQAIESVLDQSYKEIEIIVVDDGSTDNTAQIANSFQENIRYTYQSNSGPSAARNHGIKIAKGEAIAFLDIDDMWSQDKLEIHASYLAANPSVDIVQGLIQQITISEEQLKNQASFEIASQPYQFINLGSAMYRKLVFDKIGLLDETLKYAEDFDWFLRAWENNISKVVLDRVMLFYRKHDGNMTKGKQLVDLGFVRIYKKHLDRCREKGNFTRSPELPPLIEYIGTAPANKEVWQFQRKTQTN